MAHEANPHVITRHNMDRIRAATIRVAALITAINS
jgi:hypothetical protein